MRAETLLALALMVVVPAAHGRVWSIGAEATLGHEDNLFRAPAGEAVGSNYQGLALSAGWDQQISRQRLQADASVREYRYDSRSDLDNTGYGLRLAWTGETVGNFSWRVTYDAARRLASYGGNVDPAARVANLESTGQFGVGVQLGRVSKWVVGLNLNHRSLDYSAKAYAADRYRLDAVGLMVTREPLGPLSVSVGPRYTRGRYPQAVQASDGSYQADAFERGDLDLVADWTPSGASTLRARLSLTRQHYVLLSDRDVRGATGELNWRWRPTGKTSVDALLTRDSGSEATFYAPAGADETVRGVGDDSQLTTALRLRVDYSATAKLRLSLTGRHAQRDIRTTSQLVIGDVTTTTGGLAATDRSSEIGLAVRYAASRGLSLTCQWSHARRDADDRIATPYRANSAACSAQLSVR